MKKSIKLIMAAFAFLMFTLPANQVDAKSISDYTYSDYFDNVTWIDRGGEKSLSIQPDSSGPLLNDNLTNTGNEKMMHASRAFNLLENRYGDNGNWARTASLDKQFHCHVTNASGMKTPWNIEPGKTSSEVSNITCN